jgi:tRNA(Ile)-lysidine synthase
VTDAPLLHAIERAVRARVPDATVLAAVSGGPDSMALLGALCALARGRPSLRVVAAHFDHRLRPDSARDGNAVAAFAASRGVRVVHGEGDVRERARSARRSIEEAARDLRYEFLEDAASEVGAGLIATAHTRSDQVETVLMRILRGTGARGLAGIPEQRGRIVRPLLGVARADTLAYCHERGVPFVNDPTNADRRFLRNRIRHDVLPALRRAYPGIDDALERMAASARAECERVERITAGRVAASLRAIDAGAFVLGMEALSDLDDEDERVHVLASALEAMDAHRDVSRAHYRMLLRLAHALARPGTSVDLPRLRARREHDAIVFVPRSSRDTGLAVAPLALPVPGCVVLDGWEIRADVVPGAGARAEIGVSAAGGAESGPPPRGARRGDEATGPAALPLVAFIAHDDTPLLVRFPRPGDRMRPFGMKGRKKLSDLFIDRKIPLRLRAGTPVLEIANEIVWVAGVATSETSRIDETTPRAIRLVARRIEATRPEAGQHATAAAGRNP